MYVGLDKEVAERAAEQGRISVNQVIAILGQDENGDTVQVEVLNQSEIRGVQNGMDTVLEQAVLHTVADDIQIEMETPDGSVQTITVPSSSLPESSTSSVIVSGMAKKGKKRPFTDRGNGSCTSDSRMRVTVAPRASALENFDEVSVSLSFHCWLGSVTERINQTMHYQFDGHPEPLVFHAPQVWVLTKIGYIYSIFIVATGQN